MLGVTEKAEVTQKNNNIQLSNIYILMVDLHKHRL